MKKFALLVALFFSGCVSPAYSKMLSHTGNVEQCATQAYRYSQLVKYKDAGILPVDVIEIIAPRLQLPDGWENSIERVVGEIYESDLTREEVFDRIYIRCIHGYSV